MPRGDLPESGRRRRAFGRRASPDAYHVVFSDVMMPGMNGVDLAREIRRLNPGLPIVLTSRYGSVLAGDPTHGFDLLHEPYSVE